MGPYSQAGSQFCGSYTVVFFKKQQRKSEFVSVLECKINFWITVKSFKGITSSIYFYYLADKATHFPQFTFNDPVSTYLLSISLSSTQMKSRMSQILSVTPVFHSEVYFSFRWVTWCHDALQWTPGAPVSRLKSIWNSKCSKEALKFSQLATIHTDLNVCGLFQDDLYSDAKCSTFITTLLNPWCCLQNF